MVLVDSSVWIEAARRDGDLAYKVGLEGLLYEDEAVWCGPIKLEVLGGAPPGQRALLTTMFGYVPHRSIEDDSWEQAKECAWRLRDRGFTLPWNDVLIGSLARQWGCRVYAKDSHFEVMRDALGIRLYAPDYGGKFRVDAG
jgi:predicted nucleic acid-binding protein